MAQEKNVFRDEVERLLEVVMFENWLRFYFIREVREPGPDNREEAPPLAMELPDKALEKIKNLYPHLYPLARELNGKEIDFELSRKAVITYVMENLDGKKMPRGEAQRVLSSATFQTELQLFHNWVQIHESQLDQGFADFAAWQNLFGQWKESPGARELAENIKASLSGYGS